MGRHTRIIGLTATLGLLLMMGVGAHAAPVQAASARPYIVRVVTHAANARIVSRERRLGTRILHVYRHVFPGFAALLRPVDVARLRRDRGVLRVSPDAAQVVVQDTLGRATATGLWGLDPLPAKRNQRIPQTGACTRS